MAASAIAGIVVLISVLRVHPFVALVLGSLAVGLFAGLPPDKAIAVFQKGAGETLGGVGIVVVLGAMLGRLLADSGGADRLVSSLVTRAGDRSLPWAMAGAALLVGIPMFFEVGLVLLMPVIALAARRSGQSILRVGIPALAALSVLHGLIAPHPGPLIAVEALGADVARTLLAGLLVAVPSAIVAGPLFGNWIARRVKPRAPALVAPSPAAGDESQDAARAPDRANGPGVAVVLATLLLPVALMLARAVGALVGHGQAPALMAFAGHPTVAMLAGLLVAMATLGGAKDPGAPGLSARLGASFAPVAPILAILGAGGGFKQTLVESGVGDAIGSAAHASRLSPLVLAWLIAVGIRVATGSATLATVTASGIMAPIVAAMPGVSRPLLVLAIGAGSVFFSHVNDAGFWLVKEYFGMTVGETLASWSVMETILSVFALACVLALAWLAALAGVPV
ncbi:MAG TPA: gluconate:H+ symporter [Polyangiaceae bacterium]|nr:gluconate:H+ symporter [Polyangiaceae bacterium]